MNASSNDAVAVQDYVAGRLSESECEAFEARLSSEAGLVRELEESLRFREGLEMLREQGVLESLRHSRRRAPYAVTRWAAAAAVVGIVLFAALYRGGHHLDQHSGPTVAASVGTLRGGSSSAPGVVGRYSFAAMRDAASMPELKLPLSGALELRALTGVTDASRTFRVTLSRTGPLNASLIGSVEHVVPDADGSRLQPGNYGLIVEPEGAEPAGAADETAGQRFTFRLKRIRD